MLFVFFLELPIHCIFFSDNKLPVILKEKKPINDMQFFYMYNPFLNTKIPLTLSVKYTLFSPSFFFLKDEATK